MNKRTRIAVYTGSKKISKLVGALLQVWAERACVETDISYLSFNECMDAEYDMVLVSGEGLDAQTLTKLRVYRNIFSDCGFILLADNSKSAIDGYSFYPDALAVWPPAYKDLDIMMDQCFPYWCSGIDWLDLTFRRRRVRVPLYQLYYAEADGHNTVLCRAGGELRVSCSLTELEKLLPSPPFIRCQKSFIVHLCAIRRIEGNELLMRNDRVITVGRKNIQNVRMRYSQYNDLSLFTDTSLY